VPRYRDNLDILDDMVGGQQKELDEDRKLRVSNVVLIAIPVRSAHGYHAVDTDRFRREVLRADANGRPQHVRHGLGSPDVLGAE